MISCFFSQIVLKQISSILMKKPNKKKDKSTQKPINEIPFSYCNKMTKTLFLIYHLRKYKKVGIFNSLNLKGKLLTLYPKIEFIEFERII